MTAVGTVVEPALSAQLFRQVEGSSRGIPEAIFIENVEAICEGRNVPDVVAALQELYSKYQYMQSSLTAQRSSLKTKLPDITSALETVNHLNDRRTKLTDGESTEYTYQLCENIWAKASAPATDVVCLWLGANCMLEYTLEEATDLLRTNEENAKITLTKTEEDMAFLRDQLTTTEVNIARTHNHGVKVRQKLKEEGKDVPGATPTPAAPPAAIAPPIQGGSGKGYTWKQEKEEVEVSVPVPKGAQKSDVKVTILMESLKVEHSGKVLLEGDLAGKCSPGGSTWTMTGQKVEITLEKGEARQWPSLFETQEA